MPRRKIGADEGGANGAGTWPELLLMWRLAWPSGVATVLRSGTRQTTMIVVGHMGTRELGGVALGTAWVSMMGMSLVFGGFSGLDTFASQSFGAKNYIMVGVWTQRMVVIVCAIMIPLAPIWWFGCTPALVIAGIPPDVAQLAGYFAKVQVLWMFPCAPSPWCCGCSCCCSCWCMRLALTARRPQVLHEPLHPVVLACAAHRQAIHQLQLRLLRRPHPDVSPLSLSALQPLPLWLYRLLTMRLLWQDDLLLPLVGLCWRRVEPAP